MVKIAENIDLDLEILRGQRIIFQAAPGGGKSTGARLVLEAAYGTYQIIVLDVEDEFHTLRAEGRDYAIIGGDHGDAPLGSMDLAEDLALTLLRIGVSTVLQIGDLPLAEKRLFIARFVRGLMKASSDLWHPVLLMLDESHLFVPEQGVEVSSEPLVHYATAGRKRGFGAIFATQRLSLFSKDVLGVCNNKFLGRVEQSADRRAAADQLGFTPKSSEAVEMQAFQAGEFYCVGPALSPMPVRARLFLPSTSAPKPGSSVLPTATPAAIQRALAELAAATTSAPVPAPAAQPHDGPEPTADISQLPKSMGAFRAALRQEYDRGKGDAEVAAEMNWDAGHAAGRKEGYADGYATARADAGRRVLELAQTFVLENDRYHVDGPATPDHGEAIKVEATPKPPRERPARPTPGRATSAPESAPPPSGLSSPQQRCVDAIAWWAAVGFPEVRRDQAAVIAGYSPRASTFGVYISELQKLGLVEQGSAGHIRLTVSGRTVARKPPMKGRPDILQMACDQLSGKEAEVLRAVAGSYPAAIARVALADQLGLSRTASTLGVYLSALSKRGFVSSTGKGQVRAADFLFAKAPK